MKNKKVCDICKLTFTDALPCDIKDCPLIPVLKYSLKLINGSLVLPDERIFSDEEVSIDEIQE